MRELYHIRVCRDVSKVIKDQAKRCEVSANTLARQLLRAAVEAIKSHRGSLIPPRFRLEFTTYGNFEIQKDSVLVSHPKRREILTKLEPKIRALQSEAKRRAA